MSENDELILVADDDEHIVELVSMYLRKAGFRVETASDGDEALKKTKEQQPDLVGAGHHDAGPGRPAGLPRAATPQRCADRAADGALVRHR